MQIKRGIAGSPGVVTGEVLVLGTEDFRIPNRFVSIDAVESELGRFRNTLEAVWEEIEENERLARDELGDQFGAIFRAVQHRLCDFPAQAITGQFKRSIGLGQLQRLSGQIDLGHVYQA